jgi:transposase-like protein
MVRETPSRAHMEEQAIAALLTHKSVEEAARAIDLNPNTLLRWLELLRCLGPRQLRQGRRRELPAGSRCSVSRHEL